MIVLPIQKQEQKSRNHQATAMFSWDNPGLLQSSHHHEGIKHWTEVPEPA